MKNWPILLLFFVFSHAYANNLPTLNPTKNVAPQTVSHQ